MIPLPQNHYRGHKMYKERAPIFASGGPKLKISPIEAMELMVDTTQQNDMMDARWTFFHIPVSLSGAEECPPCPRCFAQWLCES